MISLTLTALCCISADGQILTSSALNFAVEMKGLSRYIAKNGIEKRSRSQTETLRCVGRLVRFTSVQMEAAVSFFLFKPKRFQ